MSTELGSSGGNAPVESSPSLATPPADLRDDAPAWIKEAGLEDAHHSAKPGGSDAPPARSDRPPARREDPAARPQPPSHAKGPAPAFTPARTPAPGQLGAEGQPGDQPPAQPSGLDEAKLASAIARGLREGQQPAQPARRPLSDQEVAARLNIFQADANTYKAILGVEPTDPAQVAALNTALQGVAKQAVTIADVMMRQHLDALNERVNPYMELIRTQEAEKQRDLFYKEDPPLAGYKQLVESTFRNILASGQRFNTVAEARKAVSVATRKLLSESGVQVPDHTSAAPSGARTTTPPARTMSPVSTGGRNGGSGKPAVPDKMTAIWGSR